MRESSILLTKSLVVRLGFAGVLLYSLLFFLQQTNLATSDLGRHLMNGRIASSALWQQDWATFQQLLTTNYYSYTQPNFPTLMHHWLFGVLATAIHSVADFGGLTLANAGIVIAGFGLLVWTVGKRTSLAAASLAALLVLPLLASRTEVRPESFSILGVGVIYALASRVQQVERAGWTQLISTALVFAFAQALWVNLHIFFPLGIAIAGLLWLEQLWLHRTVHRPLSAALVGAIIGSMCTPLGITGFLAPLTVFGNYGYQIVENMPLWFMLERFGTPLYWYMAGMVVLIGIATGRHFRQLLRTHPATLLLALIGCSGMLLLNRFANITALFVLPLLAHSISSIEFDSLYKKMSSSTIGLAAASLGGTALVVTILASGLFVPQIARAGVGLAPDSLAAAEFIKRVELPSPIFNNYDIGSYLIYSLPSNQNVFVDNRPESYPAEFMQQTLVAAQENEQRWQEVLKEYGFQSIIFYRHDQTPWAQPFLIKRIADPEWTPIYVDAYVLIVVRNLPEHQELIQQYALPPEVFKISQ